MYIIARYLLFRFHLIVIVGVVLCAHTQELSGGDHEVLITDDEDFDDGSSLYITTPSPTLPTTEDPYYVTDEYTGTYPTDVTTEVGTTTEDSEIVTPTEEVVVSDQEKIIAVREVISHEGYDDNTGENDIALLILAEELTLKDKVNAACLPDVDEALSPCVVSGWGDLEEEGNASPILQEAEVPIVSYKKCNKAYIEEYGHKTITDKMLCAGYTEGGIDSCQGDSGGPLVCKNNKGKYILRGVVSFGAGCARAERYGVYTKVHQYMDWIKENMR